MNDKEKSIREIIDDIDIYNQGSVYMGLYNIIKCIIKRFM